MKNFLRQNNLKIKSFTDMSFTFYNDTDAIKALKLLQNKFKNYSFKGKDNIITFKEALREETTSADVVTEPTHKKKDKTDKPLKRKSFKDYLNDIDGCNN